MVYYAARAQFDPPSGAVIRPFDRLRRRRNEVEYPNESVPSVTTQEVADELPKAAAILKLADEVIGEMDVFT